MCGYQQHPAAELRSTVQMVAKGVDRGPQDVPQCSQKIVAATVTDNMSDRAINLLAEVVSKLQTSTVSNKQQSSPPQRLKQTIPLRNSTASPKVSLKPPTTYPCPMEEDLSSPNQTFTHAETSAASLDFAQRMCGSRRSCGSTAGAPLEDQDCRSTSRRRSSNK